MAQKRVDILVLEQGLSQTREQAQALILGGAIWLGETRMDKPGTKIPADSKLELRSKQPLFASRGGEKLDHALKMFGVNPTDRVCLDIGASTGGFTDVLLKNGAKLVFAIDVGYGQLDYHLRNHPQVINLERTNARYLTREQLTEQSSMSQDINLVVMDVSFISMTKILAPLTQALLLPSGSDWVLLFKPQFEVGRQHVEKGGIVRDSLAIEAALREFQVFAKSIGLHEKHGPENSPIPGKKSGNLEILLHYESN